MNIDPQDLLNALARQREDALNRLAHAEAVIAQHERNEKARAAEVTALQAQLEHALQAPLENAGEPD